MYKLIYSTLLSLLLLFLNHSYTLAVVKLLTPSNGSVTQNMAETFSWTNDDVDHDYIYLFEYSFDKDFRTSIQRLPTEELNVLQGLVNNRIMYWRVKYNLKETFSGSFGNVTDAFVLGVGREIPKETPEEIELEEPKPKTEEVEEKEKLFRKNLKHQKIKEIRGKGLLLAVEIENFDMVLKLVKQGLKDGFITDWFIFHDSAFRIAPPLNITKEEILLASKLIIESLNKI